MIHMMQTNIKYSYSKPIGKGFAFNAPWWTLQHSVQWCTLPSRGHHSIARRHTSRRAEHSWFPRICPWFQCDWVTVRSTELFVFLVSGCVGGNCFNCLWCAKWKCNFQWGKKGSRWGSTKNCFEMIHLCFWNWNSLLLFVFFGISLCICIYKYILRCFY